MTQIFLCYTSHDMSDAAAIRQELRRRGIEVWWDRELAEGQNWAIAVGRALDRSDCMIVLVSPEAVGSDLVKREIEHALSNERFRGRVIPVMIRPTWVLPWCFRKLPIIDLSKDRARGLRSIVQAIKRPRRELRASG